MFIGQTFLFHIRQYAKLEADMNRDFSEPIQQFAQAEVDRLVAEGFDATAARDLVNETLTQNVLRFPVQLPTETL